MEPQGGPHLLLLGRSGLRSRGRAHPDGTARHAAGAHGPWHVEDADLRTLQPGTDRPPRSLHRTQAPRASLELERRGGIGGELAGRVQAQVGGEVGRFGLPAPEPRRSRLRQDRGGAPPCEPAALVAASGATRRITSRTACRNSRGWSVLARWAWYPAPIALRESSTRANPVNAIAGIEAPRRPGSARIRPSSW